MINMVTVGLIAINELCIILTRLAWSAHILGRNSLLDSRPPPRSPLLDSCPPPWPPLLDSCPPLPLLPIPGSTPNTFNYNSIQTKVFLLRLNALQWKCRLHSIGDSKSSNDVTGYWRKMKWQRGWWEGGKDFYAFYIWHADFQCPLHFPYIGAHWK